MSETQGNPPDDLARRPIAAREVGVFRRLAARLARMGVTPNAISLFGMATGILSGLALALTSVHQVPSHQRLLWILGAVLIQIRLLCNLIDGLVAVEGGLGTPSGELYNEIPDRVSDTATLVGLGYALGGSPAAGYAAALGAVFTAYVRAQSTAAGAPNDFCGPFAKQQRMFLVTIVALFLGLTPTAWHPSNPGLPYMALVVIIAGSLFTAARRLRRAARALEESAE